MKQKTTIALMLISVLGTTTPVFADDISELKAELLKMRKEYEQRITLLENRLAKAEQSTAMTHVQPVAKPLASTNQANTFNPAISLVLNGQVTDSQIGSDEYTISGFAIPGEGGLAREGGSLGESELTMSANIDQLLFGQTTIALHDDEGETEVEIEEAFIETIGLGNGLTARAGRFFSPIGYLNEKHIHAWNFADAPLIYRGLFGNQLLTDGVKLSYLLPTDFYLELGTALGNGNQFPGSGNHNGVGDWLVYAKTGGDIGIDHSWQIGASHWQSSPDDRSVGGGHSHGGEESEDTVSFNGDTQISNLSFIYKWAPASNRNEQLTLLSEYFYLEDDGELNIADELASYSGKQYGGFVEGIYQFAPQWRAGLRYDYLGSDLTASDTELLDDAGLDFSGYHPKRYGLMLEWLPSEFSRIRAQVNHDRASRNHDNQFILQYTVNLGAHGAHSY